MAAEKRKFVIPSVEQLDEKEAASSNSGQTFKLFKSSSDSFKSVKKNSDAEARKRLLKALSQTTTKSAENKTSPSSKIATESRGDGAALKEAHLKCSSSSTDNNEAGNVGKTFKDNFAFLKNTKHYEEAEAKMKEIESAKPVQCKVSIPSKPKPNAIQVNPRQKANPVLKFIRCVPWEFSDIVPDYVMGVTTCALFLSLRYHHFNPNYIHERLKQLGKSYELRILLVLVDVKDPHQTLRELAKMAILADLTLMLSWSSEEAGKYLEIYKVYENKPVDVLQGQNDGDYLSKLQDCLTTVKGINKTDVLTLSSTFGTLAGITSASQDDLTFLPGFGEVKASRLQNILHEPFLVKNKSQADNKT